MLNVIMRSVARLSVVMLSIGVPDSDLRSTVQSNRSTISFKSRINRPEKPDVSLLNI
jgi:hypothetical protein